MQLQFSRGTSSGSRNRAHRVHTRTNPRAENASWPARLCTRAPGSDLFRRAPKKSRVDDARRAAKNIRPRFFSARSIEARSISSEVSVTRGLILWRGNY